MAAAGPDRGQAKEPEASDHRRALDSDAIIDRRRLLVRVTLSGRRGDLDHQLRRPGAVTAERRAAAPLVFVDLRRHLHVSRNAYAPALDSTADAVNRYGADTAGAHLLDRT